MMYKVVRVEGEKFYSLATHFEAEVEYKIGEFVQVPSFLQDKNYHLLCFDTLQSVKNHVGVLKNMKCFEVQHEEIIKNPPQRYLKNGHTSWIKQIKGEIPTNTDDLGDWPDGTVMVKKVCLVKEVELPKD